MPANMRQKVRDELQNGLRLSAFVPHPPIADAELTGSQKLEFKIDTSGGGVTFEVNNKPYDPSRIDRTLPLGGVEEWTLTSFTNPAVNHPFHIHVIPHH
jgi:L-ascorbate oxidase